MNEPIWLTGDAVLALHRMSITGFGGKSGMRDRALLSSALHRAVSKWNYERASFFVLAAAYGFGIVKNHPFLDGNKRTAFLAASVFMLRHGFRPKATQEDATQTILRLASGAIDEAGFAQWLETHFHKD